MAAGGTWDKVLAAVTTPADADGVLDWSIAVDCTIARADQHATYIARHAGGWIELQDFRHRLAEPPDARTDATRERRIAKVLESLR